MTRSWKREELSGSFRPSVRCSANLTCHVRVLVLKLYCDLYAEEAIEDVGDVSFGVLARMIKHWILAVVSRIYVESAQLNAKLVSAKEVVDYILHVGVKFDKNGNIVL